MDVELGALGWMAHDNEVNLLLLNLHLPPPLVPLPAPQEYPALAQRRWWPLDTNVHERLKLEPKGEEKSRG